MAVTGGLILLKPNLNAALGSKYLMTSSVCSTRGSIHLIAARAKLLHSTSAIDSIWIKADASASIIVRFDDQMHGYFDPCTGAAIGIESRWSNLFGFVEYLHRFTYLGGRAGKVVGGVLASAMALLLVVPGLVAWWPWSRSTWKAALTPWSRPSGRARLRSHHALSGFLLSPFLLASMVTGAVLALDPGSSPPYGLTRSDRTPAPAQPTNIDVRIDALDEALQRARRLLESDPSLTTIVLPDGREPLQIQMMESGQRNPKGLNIAYANPESGAILRYVPYERAAAADRLRWWLLSLHLGLVGGVFVQALMLLAMGGMVYLLYSGVRSLILKSAPSVNRPGSVDPIDMRVVAIRDVAHRVKCFELAPERAWQLPPIEPGSHIDVSPENRVVRQYSLCNGPDQRESFIIAVRRAEDGRGGSAAMHALRVGQVVRVGPPRNRFPLVRGKHLTRLIAAGIGITPLLSMAKHLASDGSPFELHYYGSSVANIAFVDELRTTCGPESLVLQVGLSRDAIASCLLESMQEFPADGHVYACGPAGFMAMAICAARSAGIPEGRFHLERFDAGDDAPHGENGSFDVLLSRSGKRLTVATGESLLSALRRNGCAVESSCEQGLCGTCVMRVLSGDLEHRDHVLSVDERQGGRYIATCVSRCKGTLVLDA